MIWTVPPFEDMLMDKPSGMLTLSGINAFMAALADLSLGNGMLTWTETS
jgi:hypothetical protein